MSLPVRLERVLSPGEHKIIVQYKEETPHNTYEEVNITQNDYFDIKFQQAVTVLTYIWQIRCRASAAPQLDGFGVYLHTVQSAETPQSSVNIQSQLVCK